jgi:hypothetical protein
MWSAAFQDSTYFRSTSLHIPEIFIVVLYVEAEGFNNISSFKATDVSFNINGSSKLVSPDVYH